MIFQLPPHLRFLAQPCFADAWFDRAQIDAVFEGRQPGRIFVDDLDHPSAALMCRTYGYFVGGDVCATSLRQFMKDAPDEVFKDFYGFVPIETEWVQALLADFGGELIDIDRLNFKFEGRIEDIGKGKPPPPGAEIRRIDRDLAERIDSQPPPLIQIFWSNYESFFDGGFGFCTMVDGDIASVAFTVAVSDREANIDVETMEGFRRQGLSMLTSTAYIAHCLEHGMTAAWDCDSFNEPSALLARKLGFTEYPPFHQLSTPGYRPLPTSHGLWRGDEDAATGVTIWRRQETVVQNAGGAS
jgi:GNAT superfamily N-acetyltransferase